MRPDLELIEKIEDFLNGRLSAADMAAFRKQIAADADLREKVQLQEEVMKGIERASLTQKVKSAGRSFHYGNSFRKWGWGGGVAVVVVTSAVLLFNYLKDNSHTKYEGSLSLYNESGSKEWSDADRKIAPQVFTINGARDTVIESKGGIVFSIPANGFLDSDGKPVNGQIQLTVKDALDGGTIMKSGLSTQSGGRLLETGGMFYIDARTGDDILKIDPAKGIYAGVPADTIKPGMQLFQGKRMTDGSIDWVDPKPIAHDLTPVNIQSLNFYPPFYLDSLKSWSFDNTNKKFTDSLYYSFAARFNYPEIDIDGKAIFQSKCASCHILGKDATGPNLQGVIGRWGGNKDHVRAWVKNWAKAVAAGYPRAKVVQNYSAVDEVMFEGSMTDTEIDAVINYVDQSSKPITEAMVDTQALDVHIIQSDSISKSDHNSYNTCGINPAKIKAIWSDIFQNSFIATREFEQRLALIHETRNPNILDLYINNQDKNLYELDSLAAKMASGGEGHYFRNKFLAFASRRDGNVMNNSPQFQKLREYYQNKTKAYTDAITKTQNELWDKQAQLDEIYYQRTGQYQADTLERVSQNFVEEFTLNLKDVYRQLGYDTSLKQPVPQPMYNVVVTNTGWNNVDKFVFYATEERKDMTYTDPQTGKTATLKYTPVEFNIVNASQYDQVYVCLLPGKLNSYMRVNGANGKFSEKLNDLMGYNLVCIAYKGEQPFYYSRNNIKPGTYKIELKATDQSQLDRELKLTASPTKTAGILKEIDFLLFENKDRIRRQNNQSLFELVHKIEPFILCVGEGMPVPYAPLLTDSAAVIFNSPKQ